MENPKLLNALENEDNRYSAQYKRLHIDTLELKIKEKDQLLIELSSINQEIYSEMAELQARLNLSKQERDALLQENIRLKDQVLEKNTFIQQQEQIKSKLRVQLSEITNGNSFSFEQKSVSQDYFGSYLKNLQERYDQREDLIVSLQNERVELLNEIDKNRHNNEIISQVSRLLNAHPSEIAEKINFLRNSAGFRSENILFQVCDKLNCSNFDHILPSLQILEAQSKAYQNSLLKVKQYFHLSPNASLEDLDRYLRNLT